MRYFYPSILVSRLTTVHLKVLTRVEFNERGKIVRHEDVAGLKEIMEALVFLRPFAHLARRGIGKLLAVLSLMLLDQGKTTQAVQAPTTVDETGGSALGLNIKAEREKLLLSDEDNEPVSLLHSCIPSIDS